MAKKDLTPDVAVVVASHDRPLRLRWLLNALEDQTLDALEVVVAHDSHGHETGAARATTRSRAPAGLRHAAPRPRLGPGANRNAALTRRPRAAGAFTDDDCRPPRDGGRRACAPPRAAPGPSSRARPDPTPTSATCSSRAAHEHPALTRPAAWGQTCNIVYPRALLEQLGGFDEALPVAREDTDLALRARAAGADLRRRARRASPTTLSTRCPCPRRCATPGAGATCPAGQPPPGDPPRVTFGLFWKPSTRGSARARRPARRPPLPARRAARAALGAAAPAPYGPRDAAACAPPPSCPVAGRGRRRSGGAGPRQPAPPDPVPLAVLPAARDRIAARSATTTSSSTWAAGPSRSRAPTGSSTSSPTRPAASTATAPPRAPSASPPRPWSCATSATGSPGRSTTAISLRDLRAHARGRARPGLGLRRAAARRAGGLRRSALAAGGAGVGVQGPWVGWSHHRWLIDVEDGGLAFAPKSQLLDHRAADRFPVGFTPR